MKENYKETIFKIHKQEATGTLEFEALAQTLTIIDMSQKLP